MSIFSRFRKAKKAANEHKKAVAVEAEQKPPPPPYKHVVRHAAQDALAASPMTFTAEETRNKIAEVRQRKTASILRTQHSFHGRTQNDMSGPMPRLRNTISMDECMINGGPSVSQRPRTISGLSSERVHTLSSRRSYQPTNTPENMYAFAHTRSLTPLPPLPKSRPKSFQTANHKSSLARMRKSPLSSMAMEEEPEEYFSSSSQESGYTARSENASCSTSASSTSASSSLSAKRATLSRPTSSTSVSSLRNTSKCLPVSPTLRLLPMPEFVSEKEGARISLTATETSSPYQSDDEASDNDVKKAKNGLPTWSYEDFLVETDPPTIITTHSRRVSGDGISMGRAVTVMV